jgi:ACS family tartrate transporter-like MFS transporter
MEDSVVTSALHKASMRLIPFICLLYFVNYVDRINISFSALTMNATLGLSSAAFGGGASIFFVGYVLFEVPSNLILAKVGARLWIARIMVVWGVVSIAMCAVMGVRSFYAMRFLLGAAEAGFFPGIIFFLTQWFPAAHRAKMVGLFMIGMPLSGLVGAPLSTFLLDAMNGLAGLAGWQWMFILEGAPALLLGIVCLRVLPDRPADARWLTTEERDRLQAMVDHERRTIEAAHGYSIVEALTNPRVLALSVLLFLVSAGLYGSVFWIPQIIKGFGISNAAVGWLTSLPYFASVLAMLFWSRHSDATGERVWHVALGAFASALGFVVASIWLGTPIVAVIGLCLGCVGIYAAFPVFWTLPTSFLTGPAAAGAIALITASANLSGIVAPALIGWSRDLTGGFVAAMLGLAAVLFGAGALSLTFRPRVPVGVDTVRA